MKIISYTHRGVASFGAVVGNGIRELGRRLPSGHSSVETILAGEGLRLALESVARGEPDVALDEIAYLAPVPRPGKIVCVGINYRNRNEEYKDGSAAQRYPSLFMRGTDSLAAHRQALLRPRESKQLDYEGEIALVIGKPGRRIAEADALKHVAGVTCMNEGTIRDWLYHGKHNVTQGKNFDRSGSIGPWLVTRDEIGSFEGLHLTTRVNGEVRQNDSTDNMIFGFRCLIAYLSTFMTLHPGDIIATGTPTGAGARFDPPRYLQPGDRLEVEVSGVGVLCNTVEDE
jgi:2-keto-4-pentenoate hydratase/2-oxohepta-3-ene-1,7-dioic acid hydratase in catechol pathway